MALICECAPALSRLLTPGNPEAYKIPKHYAARSFLLLEPIGNQIATLGRSNFLVIVSLHSVFRLTARKDHSVFTATTMPRITLVSNLNDAP